MIKSLDQIATECGTMKNAEYHDYTRKYDKFFSPYRDKEISILEIGVAEGASLKAWYEYFPKAKIYGADIRSMCKQSENDRTKVFIGDQYNADFLKNIVTETGPLDIIVDDGSHIIEHQMFSFVKLFPYVKNNGLYVIEDLHSNYGRSRLSEKTPSVFLYIADMMEAIHFFGKNVDGMFYGNKTRHLESIKNTFEVTEIEKTLEAIHMYNSIVFIEKNNCEKINSEEKSC